MRDYLLAQRSVYVVMTPTEILASELAVLMIQYPSTPRWLFKLNDEDHGRGLAFLETRLDRALGKALAAVQVRLTLNPNPNPNP